MSNDDQSVFLATYSGIDVYECESESGNPVMRRVKDDWVNATQILKCCNIQKARRTKILERGVQTGEHEKIQGGFGRFQGTWIPLENAKKLALAYGCSKDMMPVLWLDTSDPNLKLLRKAKPLNKDGTPVKRKYVKKKKPDPSSITPSKRAKRDDSISSSITAVGQGGLSSSLSSFDPFSSFNNRSQQPSMPNSYNQYPYGSAPNQLVGQHQQQQAPPPQLGLQNGPNPYQNSQRSQVQNAPPPSFPNHHQLQQPQQYGNSLPQQRNGNGIGQHYQSSIGNYNVRPQNQNNQQPSQASYYLQQYPQQIPQNKLSVSQSTAESTWSEKNTFARDSDTSLLSNDERFQPKNGDFDSRLNRPVGQVAGPNGTNGMNSMQQHESNGVSASENNYSAQLLQFFSDDTRQIPYFIYNPPFDFDINDPIDDEGHTPLHWAASIGDANMVSLLLSKNANPIVVNNFGLNPLSKLVSFNNCYELKNFPRVLDDLEYCLINTDINGRTPLHYLCQFAKVKSKFESLSYYMDVIFAKLTTLSNQNMSNQVNLLKNVLNHQDVKGDTCLHLAARSECLPFVQYLLDYGARDDLENVHGETARQLVTGLRLAQGFDQLHTIGNHEHMPSNPMHSMNQQPQLSNDHEQSNHMSLGADDTMNSTRIPGLVGDPNSNSVNASMMSTQHVTQDRQESMPAPLVFVPTPPLNVSYHHRSNSVIDGPDLSQLAYPPHPSTLGGLAADATTSAILATPLQVNHHSSAETPDTQRTTIQHDEDLEERPIRIHNNIGSGVGTGIGKALRDQLKLLDEKDEDKENIFVDDTSMKASTPLAVLKSGASAAESKGNHVGRSDQEQATSNGTHAAVNASSKKERSIDVGNKVVESKQFKPPTLDKFGKIVPVLRHNVKEASVSELPNKLLMRDLSSMIGGMLNSLSDSYDDELSHLTNEHEQLTGDLQEKKEQNKELLATLASLLKKNGFSAAENAEEGVVAVKSEAGTISQELASKLNSLMKILERNQAFNLATLVQERELMTGNDDNDGDEDTNTEAAWEHALALTKLQLKRTHLMKKIASSIESAGADLKMFKYRKLISLSCGIRVEDIDGLIDGIADLLTENFAA